MKNRLCLVCLIAAVLPGAPAPAQRSDSRPSVPTRNSVEGAWGLVAKGQRQEACQLLREIIRKNPGNVDARLLLGSLLTESGDREEAILQLNAAVRLRPGSAEAQNALGEAFHTFGDPQAARKPFETAVSLDPNLAQAQANLGQVLIETGDSDGAAVHLDRAIRLMGTSQDAALPHYLRAKVCIAKNDPAGAAAHLNEAVRLLPDFAEAWSDLGQTRKSLLDDPGALAAFERAAKLKPDDAVAQYRLGTEYLRMDRNTEAIEHLRAAYRLNPEDQSTINGLQLGLRRSGQMEEANRIRQALSELLEKKDKARQDALMAIELNNEGALLQKNGDLRGALQKYREALDLYPEHTGIRTNLAVALLRLGDWTRGIAELREALRRNPGDAEIRKALDDALAQAGSGPPPMCPRG